MLKKLLSTIGLCAAVALPAPAVSQSGLGDLVRIEVLDGGVTDRGTYVAALRLTLSDGWKTYWRAPGDAGIPPQFDWGGSRNVDAMAITWPAPHVFDQNGVRSIGYQDQMVLPLEVTPAEPGRPVRLQGEMELGICKDVCVPGRLRFDHRLDSGADRNPTIAAAMAQRPFSADEAGVQAITCRVTPVEGGMRLEARITMPHAGGTEVAVIEPGNPELWVSEADTRRQGDTLIAASELVHVSGAAYAVDRSAVRITVLGTRHAVDIRGCAAG